MVDINELSMLGITDETPELNILFKLQKSADERESNDAIITKDEIQILFNSFTRITKKDASKIGQTSMLDNIKKNSLKKNRVSEEMVNFLLDTYSKPSKEVHRRHSI